MNKRRRAPGQRKNRAIASDFSWPSEIIEIAKRRGGRKQNIQFANGCGIELPTEIMVSMNIIEGLSLNEHEFKVIETRSAMEEAKQRGLHYIAHAQRTVHEVKNKLRSLGFPEPIIEKVVELFHGYKYLNDNDYVRSFVHDALLRGKDGPRAIRSKLLRKGISPSLIDAEAPRLSHDSTFVNNAITLAIKKYGLLRKRHGQDRHILKGKIIQYLVARGFDFELARETANNLIQENNSV